MGGSKEERKHGEKIWLKKVGGVTEKSFINRKLFEN